ncbi:MAG: thioredoxin family protein [Desulfovibrio sp.]|nr:thioredoxin family protein [Desulfovibrio sp.]
MFAPLRLLAAGLLSFFILSSAPVAAGLPDLPVNTEFARDGEHIIAAVFVGIPAGYHAYAHEPGDSGRPALLGFSSGGCSLPVFYPPGAMQRDYYDAEATVFVYEGMTTFLVDLPSDKAGMPYTLDISLLLCSAKNCLPVSRRLDGFVPDAPRAMENMPWRDIALAALRAARNGAGQSGSVPPGEIIPRENDNSEKRDLEIRLRPTYADESLEISGLVKALLAGIPAGLLLNAMPCVLPVLVLKVGGFLMLPGTDRKGGLRRLREHNLCFVAGVMTFFTALALILGLANLMWGQLYQNQTILLVLLVVVFLLGLSMLGVFTLPVVDFKFAAKVRKPRLQFYLTGFLSTFLATPCSGPLLGGVLSWAFIQSLPVLVFVFWSIGLGMSLPYLLLCVWPGMTQLLPKPGPWMLFFERIVGFLLLGTTLYLFSILPVNKYPQVLCALLLVAFCAWLWGRHGGGTASVRRRAAVGATCLVVLAVAAFIVLRPATPPPQWRSFTPEYFSARLGEKNMLLEFTADWCPNCKFLEAAVLTDERLGEWQRRYDMEFIRVDITNDNPCAIRLLEELGSKSLPLTALFPAGAKASSPLVLRDMYTVRHIEKNMNEIFFGPYGFGLSAIFQRAPMELY